MTGKKKDQDQAATSGPRPDEGTTYQPADVPGPFTIIRNIRKADPRRPNVNNITLDAGVKVLAGETGQCTPAQAAILVERGHAEIV